MLKESFLGRNPSHFQMNPIVRAYILSESLLWSAWNFVTPIAAIFVASRVQGGSIETAASGYSIYLIARVIFELISGKYLSHSTESEKLLTVLTGIFAMSFAYISFAYSQNIFSVFIAYIISGMGLGLSAPAKNTLFSIHLDKSKETTEWGMADAAQFICMALATALGGFIAHEYGFQLLFLLAAGVNILSMIPYLLYIKKK